VSKDDHRISDERLEKNPKGFFDLSSDEAAAFIIEQRMTKDEFPF
jgi:hypothetical protein